MNKKRSILLATFLILLIFTNLASAITLPDYSGDIYVQDFAEIISPELEADIRGISRSLEDQTKAQISIVTIESLEANDIETYANELFREWEIGDQEEENGVLLLITNKEKKFRLEIGYGLEGRINDAKAGDILRAAAPSFEAGNIDQGVKTIYESLIREISEEYGIDMNQLNIGPVPEAESGETKLPFWAKILIAIVFIYLAIFHPDLLMMFIYMFSRGGGGSGGGSGGSGGGSGGSRRGGGGSSGGGGASGGW